MDLGFDTFYLRKAQTGAPYGSESGLSPEWQELLPRLFAGWSARREMLSAGRTESLLRGNFDPESAQKLAGFEHASSAVNLTALGNRKPDAGISPGLAGQSQTGSRG